MSRTVSKDRHWPWVPLVSKTVLIFGVKTGLDTRVLDDRGIVKSKQRMLGQQ